MTQFKLVCLICFYTILIIGCTTTLQNNISTTDNKNARNEIAFETIIENTKESVILLIASEDNEPNKTKPDQNAMCAGAVVGEKQYIITNFHCVYNQNYLKAYFWDKEDWDEHDVNVIGLDPLADLALLEILGSKPKLRSLNFADNVTIGEDVWALGHPMGMTWTVTRGIISSTERFARHPYVKSIQTDTAINKGNSGGPLLNMKGEIVGINALIISRISENAGVAMAIRGDVVKSSLKSMLDNGRVDRPAIGVMIKPLMTDKQIDQVIKEYPTIKRKDIPNTWGLLIVPNKEDGKNPTKELPKGLKPFDTIVAINGEPINHGQHLSDELIKYKIGEVITLMVIRNHKYIKVDIPLQVFPVPIEQLYKKLP